MRTASAGLIALLNSGTQFLMADLFTLTLIGGPTLRYTSADTDIIYGGNTFSKFLINRSKVSLSVGLEVDTLDVNIQAMTTDLIGSVPFMKAVAAGALDSADFKLERVFMPTWGDTTLGAINLFQGRVSDASISRTEAKLQIKTELELLNIQLPKNFYQSGCLNTLFDNSCTLNRASFANFGTVTSSTTLQLAASTIARPDGYFSLGTIQIRSGVNSGLKRSVRDYIAGSFILSLPLPVACGNGDIITAYPGCDKLKATCETKFGSTNVIHFRGYPFVPDPEVGT